MTTRNYEDMIVGNRVKLTNVILCFMKFAKLSLNLDCSLKINQNTNFVKSR